MRACGGSVTKHTGRARARLVFMVLGPPTPPCSTPLPASLHPLRDACVRQCGRPHRHPARAHHPPASQRCTESTCARQSARAAGLHPAPAPRSCSSSPGQPPCTETTCARQSARVAVLLVFITPRPANAATQSPSVHSSFRCLSHPPNRNSHDKNQCEQAPNGVPPATIDPQSTGPVVLGCSSDARVGQCG